MFIKFVNFYLVLEKNLCLSFVFDVDDDFGGEKKKKSSKYTCKTKKFFLDYYNNNIKDD